MQMRQNSVNQMQLGKQQQRFAAPPSGRVSPDCNDIGSCMSADMLGMQRPCDICSLGGSAFRSCKKGLKNECLSEQSGGELKKTWAYIVALAVNDVGPFQARCGGNMVVAGDKLCIDTALVAVFQAHCTLEIEVCSADAVS